MTNESDNFVCLCLLKVKHIDDLTATDPTSERAENVAIVNPNTFRNNYITHSVDSSRIVYHLNYSNFISQSKTSAHNTICFFIYRLYAEPKQAIQLSVKLVPKKCWRGFPFLDLFNFSLYKTEREELFLIVLK